MTTSTRIIYYWLITGLLFIVAGGIFNWLQKNQGQPIDHHVSPINLTTSLDIPRGRYYQTNGIFHVDMTGMTRLVMAIKDIPKNPSRYDTLVIKSLTSTPHINLYWQWQTAQNKDGNPYQYRLSNYHQSINKLSPEWQNSTAITELNLVIETDITLGFANNHNSKISWQAIELINHSDINPMQQLASQLHTFVPLSFSSLNLFSNSNELVYRNILIQMGFWILLAVSLFLIIKPPAKHLLIMLILAWLVISSVYAYNFKQQISTNNMRFDNNESALNKTDQRLLEIANLVKRSIKKDSQQAAAAKILIIGNNQFEKYRLNYYLLNHNSGIVGTINDVLKTLGNDNSYTILLEPHLNLCNKHPKHDGSRTLKRLIKDTDFCLVRL